MLLDIISMLVILRLLCLRTDIYIDIYIRGKKIPILAGQERWLRRVRKEKYQSQSGRVGIGKNKQIAGLADCFPG